MPPLSEPLAHSSLAEIADTLDFGAGYGGMRAELPGKRVYAFEPKGDARETAKSRGYTEVFATEEAAFARQYDFIALFDVIEHIENDQTFLMRARRGLRDGGWIVITAPAYRYLWSTHDVSHGHIRRYTRSSLERLLEETGYHIEYVSYWNMLLFPPAAIARLLGKSGDSSFSLPRFLDDFLFELMRLESWVIRRAPLPFGLSIVLIGRAS